MNGQHYLEFNEKYLQHKLVRGFLYNLASRESKTQDKEVTGVPLSFIYISGKEVVWLCYVPSALRNIPRRA